MKRELVGGRFVQLSIFNLNHPNTGYMKEMGEGGGDGNAVAYCGFYPHMSSAARTLMRLNVMF